VTQTASRLAIGLYRRGPGWDDGKPLGEQSGVMEHIRFVAGLIEQGLVEQAGPFHELGAKVEGGLVGLVVYRVDARRAAELSREDPAVRAGLMECRVLPWYP
jgi:hypothetical protein